MKLLALVGSLALFIYIAVIIYCTAVNISRYLFSEETTSGKFWEREVTIILWPLIILTEDGRETLIAFWSKEQ